MFFHVFSHLTCTTSTFFDLFCQRSHLKKSWNVGKPSIFPVDGWCWMKGGGAKILWRVSKSWCFIVQMLFYNQKISGFVCVCFVYLCLFDILIWNVSETRVSPKLLWSPHYPHWVLYNTIWFSLAGWKIPYKRRFRLLGTSSISIRVMASMAMPWLSLPSQQIG